MRKEFDTTASGFASHAEGGETIASGNRSHAEGNGTTASGSFSHAEGFGTTASGIASHAEGSSTTASGQNSHAEGNSTIASGGASHAEGFGTTASGQNSHAEGNGTTASAAFSHAEGFETIADANYSHAEGNSTSTGGLNGVHIMGRFGDANDLSFSWYLANGTSPTNKGIAAKILQTGAAFADIGWFGGGADYAEMFETVDGNPIETGYFVTLDGKKIRKANERDDYILGITSANPVVLGDSAELRWEKKFQTDEWGRILYHDVIIPGPKR
ncbi:peptidase G2 autoproteolytic cleavage domain-containing protein [Ectobacillus funiculus]